MRLHLLTSLLAFGLASATWAVELRVHGLVSDHRTREPLQEALVRVYKNGEKQHVFHTGPGGRYSVRLDNNAHYVIRFSAPGRVTKCFTVDTSGPAWADDKRATDLEVEMTLFEPVDGLDLGWFDMPMGMARFTPMTGHIAWNADYERRIRPEVDRLMAEVALRQSAIADRGTRSPVGTMRH